MRHRGVLDWTLSSASSRCASATFISPSSRCNKARDFNANTACCTCRNSMTTACQCLCSGSRLSCVIQPSVVRSCRMSCSRTLVASRSGKQASRHVVFPWAGTKHWSRALVAHGRATRPRRPRPLRHGHRASDLRRDGAGIHPWVMVSPRHRIAAGASVRWTRNASRSPQTARTAAPSRSSSRVRSSRGEEAKPRRHHRPRSRNC